MGCKDIRRGDRSDCKLKVLQGWTMQVNWFHKLSTKGGDIYPLNTTWGFYISLKKPDLIWIWAHIRRPANIIFSTRTGTQQENWLHQHQRPFHSQLKILVQDSSQWWYSVFIKHCIQYGEKTYGSVHTKNRLQLGWTHTAKSSCNTSGLQHRIETSEGRDVEHQT
jgi:hypothetical protein